MPQTASDVTTDHEKIREWAEARKGRPATVKGTASDSKKTNSGGKGTSSGAKKDDRGGEEPGILRIDFPGYSGEQTLEEISWDEFFQKFEEANLAFLYQEKTSDGKTSRFCKFIARNGD